MVDRQSSSVCCMCGDVGFPDKLFRCNKCCNRLQHSYCSSYYNESTEPIEVCEWCQSEERSTAAVTAARHGSSSKKCYSGSRGGSSRSVYAGGDRVKQPHDHQISHREDKGKGSGGGVGGGGGGAPSPRTATRRYKLLKDVMC